jgi:hypothetical protein
VGKDISVLISLGFSNQTRLVIDQFGTNVAAMPFDKEVITRAGFIDALRSDGSSLSQSHRPGRCDDGTGHAACWRRFAKAVRSKVRKTFVLSNADHGLRAFAVDDADFDRTFGLGRSTYVELMDALEQFGARNYSVTFLSRSLGEIEETATLCDPKLDHRFVGTLSLRPDDKVAASLFSAFEEPSLAGACGAYDRSEKIIQAVTSDVAIVYKMAGGERKPLGCLTRLNGGFAAFFEGRDKVYMAVGAERGLYFSNGVRWMKDAPAS